MNERIEKLKQRARDHGYRVWRRETPIMVLDECEREGLSWPRRMARLTRRQCEAEAVVIEPDERIVFTRTLPSVIPAVYGAEQWAELTAGRTLHELGPISNICADWGKILAQGLLGRRQAALAAATRLAGDASAVEFLECAIETIDAVLALAARYAPRPRARSGAGDRRNARARPSPRPAHVPRGPSEPCACFRPLCG